MRFQVGLLLLLLPLVAQAFVPRLPAQHAATVKVRLMPPATQPPRLLW